MDQARFEEAQRALAAKDYRAAAEGFLAAAGGPGGPGNGEAYHLAGNALMKLRKYQHAATVYQHALRDTTYPKLTAVLVNLATAQAAMGEYADAVAVFTAALNDPAYPKRYKLLQGRAGALYAMGRYDEAARDYIAAAEPGNPDRGRAFNNLGLTLAASARYAEAVDAYKAALATEGYDGKGRAAANLGLSLTALGRYAEALAAFDTATSVYGHTLAGPALEAYATVSRAVPVEIEEPQPAAAAPREVVEAWETAELGPTPAEEQQPPAEPAPAAAPQPEAQREEAQAEPAVEVPVVVQSGEDSEFFTRTDQEMRALDKETRRQERAERRNSGNTWARAAGAALLLIVLVGGSAGVFFAGYGYPTQRQTVGGMLDAYHRGRPVTDYWVAAPTADVTKEMATIPPNYATASIDSVNQSAFSSKVTITVKLEKGAPLRYTVSLSREGVGWKVVGIDNDWGSAGGS